MTKEKLFNDLDTSYKVFRTYLDEFPKDKYDYPIVGEYTYKDVIAHIYEWENFLSEQLPLIDKMYQAKKVIPGKLNIKAMNAVFYERNKSLSLEMIREKFAQSHKKVIEDINNFTEDFLLEPDPYYPKGTNLHLIEECTTLHYQYEVGFLKKALKKVI